MSTVNPQHFSCSSLLSLIGAADTHTILTDLAGYSYSRFQRNSLFIFFLVSSLEGTSGENFITVGALEGGDLTHPHTPTHSPGQSPWARNNNRKRDPEFARLKADICTCRQLCL